MEPAPLTSCCAREQSLQKPLCGDSLRGLTFLKWKQFTPLTRLRGWPQGFKWTLQLFPCPDQDLRLPLTAIIINLKMSFQQQRMPRQLLFISQKKLNQNLLCAGRSLVGGNSVPCGFLFIYRSEYAFFLSSVSTNYWWRNVKTSNCDCGFTSDLLKFCYCSFI